MAGGRKPLIPKPGERYNMLTFIEPAGRKAYSKMGGRLIYAHMGKWKCDCGNEVVCRNSHVVKGRKKSCGCLLRVSGASWRKRRHLKKNLEPVKPIDNLAAAIMAMKEMVE